MRVADYLLSKLADQGIDTVFGLTGGGIMHLIDAISLSESVKFQAVHHEEFAGVCADGYARSGRKFGVAFATTGPGGAHLFTATAAAWQDSVPLLLIIGQVKTSDSSRLRGNDVRQNGTFEFDTIGAFSHITKKASIVSNSEEAVEAINEAISLCQEGRPGPVLIEIPLDVQGSEISETAALKPNINANLSDELSSSGQEFLKAIGDSIRVSQRPIILFGAGAVRSHSESLIEELVSTTSIPYVVTQFARGLGDIDHQLFLGSPGVKANKSANLALTEADLIIAIGTSLHQQVIGWNEDAFKDLESHKIWTEIDSNTRESRKHLVDEAFNVDSSQAIQILIKYFQENSYDFNPLNNWRERVMSLREKYLLHFPVQKFEEGRFCVYKAISILSQRANRFRSIVTDAGVVWYAVPQHFFPARGSFFISSGSFGSMGMALPLAIGSATATNNPTLCITGDGSLMTCLQELATLALAKLPILLIINSNNGYASIRSTHDKFFNGRKIGTDGSNGVLIPKYRELAKVFNIEYACASTETDLIKILDSDPCSSLNSPMIIEVMTLVNQSVEPVIVSKLSKVTGQMESGSLIDLFPMSDK